MTDNALLKRIIQQGDSTAAQMRRKIVSLEARAIGGDENCPQCARLRRRITRFFEQKRIIKAAYVENVMMVSHGQVDRRALIEAERYLLVDSDDEIRTFGEIRDSEIERSLSLLKHVKTQKQIENETTTNPNT
jgi:hypothetical protein